MTKTNQVQLCTEITGVECEVYMNRKIYCVAKVQSVKMLHHVLHVLKNHSCICLDRMRKNTEDPSQKS